MAKSRKGGKRSDPTANIALARCYRQRKPVPRVALKLMKRTVKDGDRIWVIWMNHEYAKIPTRAFKTRWGNRGSFVVWLEREGVIYKRHEIIKD